MNEELILRAVVALETIAAHYTRLAEKSLSDKESERSISVVRQEGIELGRKTRDQVWRDRYGDIPVSDSISPSASQVLEDFTHTDFQK